MKIKSGILGLVAVALMSTSAMASDLKLGGEVGMGTDYISRGYSLTDGDPQIFGRLEARGLPYGFTTGVWASNAEVGGANSEWGFYVANSQEVGGGLTVGGDAYYYTYPGNDGNDYWEFGLNANYDFGYADLTGAVYWSPEYYGWNGDGWYKTVTLTVPVVDSFSVYGTGGHQAIDGLNNTWDYGFGVLYTVDAYTVNVGWNGYDTRGADDSRVVSKVSYAF